MKKILIALSVISLMGCNKYEFDDSSDYRNFLRDKFPYSELQEIKIIPFGYVYYVNDTINHQEWICRGKNDDHKQQFLKK